MGILVCKQTRSNSFKNEINDKLVSLRLMFIYLNVYKQLTDIKMLLFHSNA